MFTHIVRKTDLNIDISSLLKFVCNSFFVFSVLLLLCYAFNLICEIILTTFFIVYYFFLIFSSVPVFCVTLLMILVVPNDMTNDSIEIFQYGSGEAILTLFILIVSFIGKNIIFI